MINRLRVVIIITLVLLPQYCFANQHLEMSSLYRKVYELFTTIFVVDTVVAIINVFWKKPLLTLLNGMLILPCILFVLLAFRLGPLLGISAFAIFILQMVLMFRSDE